MYQWGREPLIQRVLEPGWDEGTLCVEREERGWVVEKYVRGVVEVLGREVEDV